MCPHLACWRLAKGHLTCQKQTNKQTNIYHANFLTPCVHFAIRLPSLELNALYRFLQQTVNPFTYTFFIFNIYIYIYIFWYPVDILFYFFVLEFFCRPDGRICLVFVFCDLLTGGRRIEFILFLSSISVAESVWCYLFPPKCLRPCIYFIF